MRRGGEAHLEEADESSAVLEQRERELQRVAGAGVDVLRVGDELGQRVEEAVDGAARVGEVDEERGRNGEEAVVDLCEDELAQRARGLLGEEPAAPTESLKKWTALSKPRKPTLTVEWPQAARRSSRLCLMALVRVDSMPEATDW